MTILLRAGLSLLLYVLAAWLFFRYGLATAEPEPLLLAVFCPPLVVAGWAVWPTRVY